MIKIGFTLVKKKIQKFKSNKNLVKLKKSPALSDFVKIIFTDVHLGGKSFLALKIKIFPLLRTKNEHFQNG